MMLAAKSRILRNRETIRVVFVASTLLFLLAFVCFATSSSPFATSTTRLKRDIVPSVSEDKNEKERSSDCPIEAWNRVETNEIPHADYGPKWTESKASYFHPALLGAFLFDRYILMITNTKGMAGRPVFCRYFDCLRREIPNQFESKIYPESVVYCPRRVGALFVSVSGNVSERPDYPIAIEDRFKKTSSSGPTSTTTVEAQIGASK
ncbi:unnamed protein product [Caenorhabditis sp. 36 PRJEB53466]|nr:unnamed protein product [Caenorhabditis sp. 36 PRJEB53466]